MHVSVEVQLAAFTCSITASPRYLRLRNLTLIGIIGFPSRDLCYLYDQRRLHLFAHYLLTIREALADLQLWQPEMAAKITLQCIVVK